MDAFVVFDFFDLAGKKAAAASIKASG